MPRSRPTRDAEVLAQMLRGGFIPYRHMPSRGILDMRHLIRHRRHMAADHRTLRRRIHAILLARGIRIGDTPFSKRYVRTHRDLKDYRIDDCLDIMGDMDACIGRVDRTIRAHALIKCASSRTRLPIRLPPLPT